MRFEAALWLFPVAVTVHNLEEAIWLPAWSQHAGIWNRPHGAGEFRMAAALLALATYFLVIWSNRSGKQSLATYITAGFLFAMLLNVAYHVAATLGLRRYAPGVVTALLIILPVTLYLLRRAIREQYVLWPRVLFAFVVVPAAMALVGIRFFLSLGRGLSSTLRL